MSVHTQTIIQWMEQFAPKHLAEDWDPVGLQVGSMQRRVSKVMTALEVTDQVVEEAIAENVQLIIAHHPLLFRPLKQLNIDYPQGQLLEKLIKHDITVYAAHTNLDITQGGMNDWLAEALKLEQVEVLHTIGHEPLKKLVVFVPRKDEAQLRQALGDVGAGFIGNYSHCSFRTQGIGTFLPGAGTNPHIGQQGKLEQVEEVKIETIFPASMEKKILGAMLKAHPYEEPASEIYVLDQKGEPFGIGRVGYLPEQTILEAFGSTIKEVLDTTNCRLVGADNEPIKKVAILGGKGMKYMSAALFKGADVFVTGDIDYHAAHDALANGLCLIDPGHHVEHIMIKGVRDKLQQVADEQKVDIEIITSQVNVDPFKAI